MQNPVLWSCTERKKWSRRSQIKRPFLSQWFWCKQLSGLRKLTPCGDINGVPQSFGLWWSSCSPFRKSNGDCVVTMAQFPTREEKLFFLSQSINHLNDKKVRMKLSRNNWIYEISFEKMDGRGSKWFNFKALLQLISCLQHISQTSLCCNIKVRTSSYWIKIFLSMHYGNLIILI